MLFVLYVRGLMGCKTFNECNKLNSFIKSFYNVIIGTILVATLLSILFLVPTHYDWMGHPKESEQLLSNLKLGAYIGIAVIVVSMAMKGFANFMCKARKRKLIENSRKGMLNNEDILPFNSKKVG